MRDRRSSSSRLHPRSALEHAQDPEHYERALDAISRFDPAAHPGFAKLAGPVAKRSRALWKSPAREHTLQIELIRAALAWTTRELHSNPYSDLEALSAPARFFLRRTDALLVRVRAGRHGPMLSTPTHRHGYVDSRVLLERLRARTDAIDLPDAVLAMHRVGPRAAHGLADQLKGRVEDLGPVSRAAQPLDPGRLTPTPKRFESGKYHWHRIQVAATPGPCPVTPHDFAEHVVDCLARGNEVLELGDWLFGALPHASEWTAAAEAAHIGGYGYDETTPRAVLHAWDDASVQPGPNGYRALAIALGARASATHLSARDALVANMRSGRLSPTRLGEAFASLLPTGMIKPTRWAKELGEVAGVSPLHADRVRQSLLGALRGEPAAAPREMGKLLLLCLELHVAGGAGCDDPEARIWLGAVDRGPLSAVAKALLARPTHG